MTDVAENVKMNDVNDRRNRKVEKRQIRHKMGKRMTDVKEKREVNDIRGRKGESHSQM